MGKDQHTGDSIEYHRKELEIALDPANPARALPPFSPSKHKRILDVGCGMGQSLIAAQFSADVQTFGADRDLDALKAGRRLAPPNVHLLLAAGEDLPFESNSFDLVFSRVALPYMVIGKALNEFSRVLKPGGDVWLMLHPASMVLARVRESASSRNVKDLLFCGYIFANGLLFNYFGKQISFAGRQETFQTAAGIVRAMKQAGLNPLPTTPSTHFIIQGQKLF